MAKLKFSSGNTRKKDPTRIQTVSDTAVFSSYLASAAILAIAIIEAENQFQQGSVWVGLIYIILALIGVLFSVIITLWNQRNKKLQKEQKKK